jgi:hypothetical protein
LNATTDPLNAFPDFIGLTFLSSGFFGSLHWARKEEGPRRDFYVDRRERSGRGDGSDRMATLMERSESRNNKG